MAIGIDHTKQAVVALTDLSVFAIGIVKHGFGFSEMIAIAGKIALLKKVLADVPMGAAELKDLDTEEMKQLVMLVTDCVAKVAMASAK